jgi:hypothetical protein
MTRATGGYVITKMPPIMSGETSHTAALKRPVSQVDLQAINRLQDTGWRQPAAVGRHGGSLGPPDADRGTRNRLPRSGAGAHGDEDWAALSVDGRKACMAVRQKAHDTNASIAGREHAILNRLSAAQLYCIEVLYPRSTSRAFPG